MGCGQNKSKIIKNKNKLIIGIAPSNETYTKFDDNEVIQPKGGFYKIFAIKVVFNIECIFGLEVAYELDNGSIITGGDHDSCKPIELKEEVFEVPTDDFLQEISGRAGKVLYQICFKTYKGFQCSYGNDKGGKVFGIKFESQTFGPFAGSLVQYQQGKIVNSLEIPIVPVPQEFINSIRREYKAKAL